MKLRLVIIAIVTFVASAVADAQVRYELIKTVYDDGLVQNNTNSTIADIVTFYPNSDYITIGNALDLTGTLTFRYKLVRFDGQIPVYYQVAVDMVNGQEYVVGNNNSYVAFSPDYSKFNIRSGANFIQVYQRRDEAIHDFIE